MTFRSPSKPSYFLQVAELRQQFNELQPAQQAAIVNSLPPAKRDVVKRYQDRINELHGACAIIKEQVDKQYNENPYGDFYRVFLGALYKGERLASMMERGLGWYISRSVIKSERFQLLKMSVTIANALSGKEAE